MYVVSEVCSTLKGFLPVTGYEVTHSLYEVGMVTLKNTEKYLETK